MCAEQTSKQRLYPEYQPSLITKAAIAANVETDHPNLYTREAVDEWTPGDRDMYVSNSNAIEVQRDEYADVYAAAGDKRTAQNAGLNSSRSSATARESMSIT